MTDLVPKMSKQRAVTLRHRQPEFLAFRVVGLGDIDRDDAVLMTGHNSCGTARRSFREKIESQTLLGIVGAVRQGQVQT